ncbi:MAG: class I SAM-dependent methyltransferase [Candidatus Heimdallarchaeaceae archaeon]
MKVFTRASNGQRVFGVKKTRHAGRLDPELPFIERLQPETVLEVGSAYGRVTRKILALKTQENSRGSSLKLTGLEINPHFQKYIALYSKEYPELSKAKFVFGDIFEARKVLPQELFDVVIILMNTVPNFPFDSLEDLFTSVYELLRKGGHFIFSVNNKEFSDDDIKQGKDN